MNLHDWNINEMFAPIWIEKGVCVLSEGVEEPPDAVEVFRLVRSTSFGTGGHPATKAVLDAYRRVRSTHMAAEARVLDFGAGTGLLSLVAKSKCESDVVIAVVNPDDHETIEANQRINPGKIDDVVMPGYFCKEDARRFWASFFDITMTQTGSIFMLDRLELLEKYTAPAGALIFGGHKASDHRFCLHRIAEFFQIIEVSDHMGWPVILAQPLPKIPDTPINDDN